MRWVGVCVVLAWALSAAPAHAAVCADADTPYAPQVNESQVRAALVCLINNERVARGLEPVKPVGALDLASQRHVNDMAARGFLGHLAPEPAPYGVTPHDRAEAAGYRGGSHWEVGEVMHYVSRAQNRPQLTTPREAMAEWIVSGPHCGTLLAREARHVGVGLVHSTAEEGLVTEIVEVIVGVPGMTMTRFSDCPFAAGLVAPDATPPAATTTPAPQSSAPTTTPAGGVALGATGVSLSSPRQIKLKPGASAAPLALKCGRASCRGTASLWARGRILGRVQVVITEGVLKRFSVPIARKYRKRLLRRATTATLRLAIGGARADRNITLRG